MAQAEHSFTCVFTNTHTHTRFHNLRYDFKLKYTNSSLIPSTLLYIKYTQAYRHTRSYSPHEWTLVDPDFQFPVIGSNASQAMWNTRAHTHTHTDAWVTPTETSNCIHIRSTKIKGKARSCGSEQQSCDVGWWYDFRDVFALCGNSVFALIKGQKSARHVIHSLTWYLILLNHVLNTLLSNLKLMFAHLCFTCDWCSVFCLC